MDIQQLYELLLAKLTEKQLDLLPQDKKYKRQKWLANVSQLRRYQSRLQTSADNLNRVIAESGPTNSQRAHLMSLAGNGSPGGDLSDDSDVSIEFNSEDAKKDFQQRIGALRKQK